MARSVIDYNPKPQSQQAVDKTRVMPYNCRKPGTALHRAAKELAICRNHYAQRTGQFSSSGGRTQLRAANVRAVEPAPNLPGAERGNLYMLVEVSGSGGGHAALYRQILNAAQTAFYEASGNQSAALIRAVRSAHFVLVRANEGSARSGLAGRRQLRRVAGAGVDDRPGGACDRHGESPEDG